jgi:hypothetical protein
MSGSEIERKESVLDESLSPDDSIPIEIERSEDEAASKFSSFASHDYQAIAESIACFESTPGIEEKIISLVCMK